MRIVKPTSLMLVLATAAGLAYGEPLADFESITKKCRQAFDTRHPIEVVYVARSKAWVKRVYGPTRVAYDVRKTDSLVSPFLGYIEIVELIAVDRAADEATATALQPSLDNKVSRLTQRLNFAYRDSLWTLVDGTMGMEYKSEPDGRFSPPDTTVRLTKESIVLKATGPAAACLGAP
jgi:hypothetical protein